MEHESQILGGARENEEREDRGNAGEADGVEMLV